MRLVSVGRVALKIYANHMISFSAGAIAGSVQTMFICAALWLRTT